MATVWAARIGDWKNAPTTGWSHFFKFHNVSELFQPMDVTEPPLTGAVTKLALVAHGDLPGIVKLGPDLTPDTTKDFKSIFDKLNKFLAPHGRLIFYSCIAGAGDNGTRLLIDLSGSYFPNRHVIGFEVFGRIAPEGYPNQVGVMEASESPERKFTDSVETGPHNTFLNEYAWQAKWAFQGRIIKKSKFDQGATVKVRRIVHGPKAVEDAIERYPRNGIASIEYVAIEDDRAKEHQLRKVVDVFANNHTLDSRKQLKFLSRSELSGLTGTANHNGVAAVFVEDVRKLKCADPKCPGHHVPTDFCTEFVRGIPNGPLI
jgi:hypothetical protein